MHPAGSAGFSKDYDSKALQSMMGEHVGSAPRAL